MTAVWLGRGSIAHAAVKIQCSLTNFLINNQILSYPRISGYPKHSILYPKRVISYDRIASLFKILSKTFEKSDWGEVRSSNRSSPHFFCEVWGEDPQFFLCEEWGEVPQFHCEVEEKRYSSLFLNSNAQMPQKSSIFLHFRQICGMPSKDF